MRKAILSLVVLFAVAAVASAVPAGPGGTMYFGDYGDEFNLEQRLYRLNVDSNWNPVYDDGTSAVGNNDAVLHYATVADDLTHTDSHYGMRSIWYHPVSGKLDMNGSYHNASVLTGAYYNDVNCGSYGNGSVYGADILSVRTGASVAAPDVTVLHDGIDSGAADTTNPHTSEHRLQVTVDSGFTGTGEATGFANMGDYASAVWEDNGDGESGYCANGVDVGGNFGVRGSAVGPTGYAPCGSNSYIDGGSTAVTGLLVTCISNNYGYFRYTYKTDSGYTQIVDSSGTVHENYIKPTAGCSLAMADTDNDGILDAYWAAGDDSLVHAQDGNDDGDWVDDGETWDASAGLAAAILDRSCGWELVECPGEWEPGHSKWAMVVWSSGWSGRQWIKVFGLDAAGDWDGVAPTEILNASNDTSIQLLWRASNVSSGGTGYGRDRFAFAPLGEAIPEPATMMLVGTGLLSLVGVIRRRRLN